MQTGCLCRDDPRGAPGRVALSRSAPPRRPTLGRLLRAAVSFCALSLGPVLAQEAPPALVPTVADEYRLKAAVVLRFPQFVEWPAPSLTAERTFGVCVMEPDPFGEALTELALGEQIGPRPIVTRRVRSTDPLLGCHVLFVPAEMSRRPAVLQRLTLRPVLTVSDAPRFLDEGGMVQLRLVSNRVRFDISTEATARAGLRISAQLLALATSVRGGPP